MTRRKNKPGGPGHRPAPGSHPTGQGAPPPAARQDSGQVGRKNPAGRVTVRHRAATPPGRARRLRRHAMTRRKNNPGGPGHRPAPGSHPTGQGAPPPAARQDSGQVGRKNPAGRVTVRHRAATPLGGARRLRRHARTPGRQEEKTRQDGSPSGTGQPPHRAGRAASGGTPGLVGRKKAAPGELKEC